MTKKIEFWLVTAIFAIGAISGAELISPLITVAAPTKEIKSVGTVDKLIFSFKGGEKKQQPRLEMTGKRRTRVAGSRGCGADIVALMPRSNLGVTSSTNPTFWFYLPPTYLESKSLTFRVFQSTTATDSTEQEIWKTQIPLRFLKIPTGLLRVPYQGQLLTTGNYRWESSYQQVGCSSPQVLSGYVQKEIHPNLEKIKQPRDRLQFYAKNGIWHELLTELIILHQQLDGILLTDDFRYLLVESEDVKYTLSSDRQQVDRDLIERIVTSIPIN